MGRIQSASGSYVLTYLIPVAAALFAGLCLWLLNI